MWNPLLPGSFRILSSRFSVTLRHTFRILLCTCLKSTASRILPFGTGVGILIFL